MKNWLIIFISNISFFNIIQSQIQYRLLSTSNNSSDPSEPTYDSGFYFTFCLGYPSQCFNLLYDTMNLVTVIPDKSITQCQNTFDSSISKYFSFDSVNNSVLIHNGTISGREANDRVYPNEQSLFKFILADLYDDLKTHSFDGIISLSKSYINFDRDYSIINYLYKCNKIKRKLFAHKYINDNEGTLFIGDLGNVIVSQTETCQSGLEGFYKSYWGCILKQIKIGTDRLMKSNEDSVALFSVGQSQILSPFEIGKEIINYYYALRKSDCYKVNDYLSGALGMTCKELKETKLSTLPVLTIELNGHSITLKQRDLFIRTESKWWVFSIKAVRNRVSWEIGNVALRNEFMVFDMDKQEVSFLIEHHINNDNDNSNDNDNDNGNSNSNTANINIINIITLIVILCLIGLIIELYALITKK